MSHVFPGFSQQQNTQSSGSASARASTSSLNTARMPTFHQGAVDGVSSASSGTSGKVAISGGMGTSNLLGQRGLIGTTRRMPTQPTITINAVENIDNAPTLQKAKQPTINPGITETATEHSMNTELFKTGMLSTFLGRDTNKNDYARQRRFNLSDLMGH